MGDLIRKYIALDGYVRHYLPIRGAATMRDTLRHYRVCDAPSFRLVHNAIHALMMDVRRPRISETDDARAGVQSGGRSRAGDALTDVDAEELPLLCRRALAALPDFGSGEQADLLRDIAASIAARLAPLTARVTAVMTDARDQRRLLPSWVHLMSAIAGPAEAPNPTFAQQLMEVELAVSLLECWTRAAEMDRAISGGR
jgi:hypothetical protein